MTGLAALPATPTEAPVGASEVPPDAPAPNQLSPAEPQALAPLGSPAASDRGTNPAAITGAAVAGTVALLAMLSLAALVIRGYRRRNSAAEAGVQGEKNSGAVRPLFP